MGLGGGGDLPTPPVGVPEGRGGSNLSTHRQEFPLYQLLQLE